MKGHRQQAKLPVSQVGLASLPSDAPFEPGITSAQARALPPSALGYLPQGFASQQALTAASLLLIPLHCSPQGLATRSSAGSAGETPAEQGPLPAAAECAGSSEQPQAQCGSEAPGAAGEQAQRDRSASRGLQVQCGLLVPCRAALKGRFPLQGTYFQPNEVFLAADVAVQVCQELCLAWNDEGHAVQSLVCSNLAWIFVSLPAGRCPSVTSSPLTGWEL